MKVFVFVDASNLFYGGEKSLGWKIDYEKLFWYLKDKYSVSRALYFGGVEIYDFPYNYLKDETVPIAEVKRHLTELIRTKGERMTEAMLLLVNRHIQRARFYLKLK
jgi:hypothetical protein